ncbi:hypothetical protein AC1031_001684 [Aphanomyces cochlioides]|nr:hypothetical protein AC1031_001684 [Aphanomyces cochlioides]
MPFKPYLSEQASILPPSFRASPPFPATLSVPFPPETWNFFLEYYARQPREYNYVNDVVHNIEIVRTALRYNSTVRLTDLHGGPYFPIKLVDQGGGQRNGNNVLDPPRLEISPHDIAYGDLHGMDRPNPI